MHCYDDNVERFYHEITKETPAFQRRINTVDLLKPIFVQPNGINKRMVAQHGAFIISGLSRTPKQSEGRRKSFVCAEIIIKKWENILKELYTLGINEASLFIKLKHTANYLKSKINKIEKKKINEFNIHIKMGTGTTTPPRTGKTP